MVNGMPIRSWWLVWSFVAVAVVSARADLSCRAEVDRRTVPAGGQVVLTLHAEGDVGGDLRHARPRIEGVEVVPGGTSKSFRLVNGRSEHSLDATYYLVVRRDTDFRIPAITFTAGDRSCTTEPVGIAVTAARDRTARDPAAGTPPPAASGPATRQGSGPQAGRPGDPYFITLDVDHDQVRVGQQVVLTFRYHYRRSAWNQPSYTPPRTEGFWRVDLPPERRYRRTVAGHAYDVTEIRYALFPTRAGDLQIGPARLEIAGDPFDRFFGRRTRGPVRLATDPIPVSVEELPLPRPDRFSGVVADQLAFTATVDRDTVPRGEPLALRLTVEADGFLKSFGGVPVREPAGVRIHDAAENLRENVDGSRYRAAYIQEKAAVPTREGLLRLPPLELVYFDTGRDAYVTATADVAEVVVTPSDLPVAGDDPSGFRRSEIARLGNDLAFVHPLRGPVGGTRLPAVESPVWWVLAVLPWLVLAGYGLHLRRLGRLRRDPLGQRRRQALSVAKRRLAEARRTGDAALLAAAILGFVADHLGRGAAALTASEVASWASARGHRETARRLAEILDGCDRARYGGARMDDVAGLAREVEELLPHLLGDRRPRPADRARVSLLLVLLALLGGDAAAATVAAPGADPARLLAEGNQAYTEGELEQARELYRQALARGGDAAELHYNLGNVHARQGELGRAIAGYLRAQRRAPRDGDIRRNLAWVRSHTRDLELAGHELPPVIAQLDRAAHWLSVREWGLLLVVCSWLVVLPLALAWRRGGATAGLRRAIVAAVALLVLAGAVTATRWYEESWRDIAVVVSPEVSVRSGPATSFPAVFQVHDGLTAEVRGERDGWRRIGLGGDWVGWVPAGVLVPVRQGR